MALRTESASSKSIAFQTMSGPVALAAAGSRENPMTLMTASYSLANHSLADTARSPHYPDNHGPIFRSGCLFTLG